jgi:O-antigen ligase
MIRDAPLTGFGLGTFEAAYPPYAQDLVRLTVDKAHNDYLELAAGFGLPAAVLWWIALLWLVGLCVRAATIRKYGRVYPVTAVGATALVGTHAIVDFSLQMPAVAITYAALLGLGVAQSFSSREA